jgi:hypothetical protein
LLELWPEQPFVDRVAADDEAIDVGMQLRLRVSSEVSQTPPRRLQGLLELLDAELGLVQMSFDDVPQDEASRSLGKI